MILNTASQKQLKTVEANNKPNLIPFPYYDEMSKTTNGITFTVNADGSVTANGTASANAYIYLHHYTQGKLLDNGKTYTLSDGVISSDIRATLTYYNGTSSVGSVVDVQNSTTFTTPSSGFDGISLTLWIKSGTTVNQTFYLMLVEGDTAPTEFKLAGGLTCAGTIAAGQTEITLYSDEIRADSLVEPFFKDKILAPTDVKVNNGSIVITIDAQDTDTVVGVRCS